jgi:Arc/MetJ-type ribon-helix-helix transcriptional regulator
MPNGKPVLVYFPKELIDHMNEMVRKGDKYVSRSDLIRAATRMVVDQDKSLVLKELREDRKKTTEEYLKKAKGNREKAIEMFHDDLIEMQKKDPFYSK